MPGLTLHQMTATPTVKKLISRVKTPTNRLAQFWGMQIGGPNASSIGGRYVGWDVMDVDRGLAKGRAPGSGPATSAPTKVGHVTAVAYRSHEKVPLLYERIYRNRALGAQWGTVDVGGQSYIVKQQKQLAQRFSNMREFMVAMMMRGKFRVQQSGDDFIPVLPTESTYMFEVDYQIPAGNKSQLNMLGTGSIIGTAWSSSAAPIVQDILQIQEAFENLHGWPLEHAWCNSNMLYNLFNNTELKSMAGTANIMFDRFEVVERFGPEGIRDNGYTVVFKALPWLIWHIYDGVLSINGTVTKVIADNTVTFCPTPTSDIAEFVEGSEPIQERTDAAVHEETGFVAWTTPAIDPPALELKAVDNGIPGLYLPKCIAHATVAGF